MTHATIEKGGLYDAIYGPLLALHHTAWTTQKGIVTFQGLGAYSSTATSTCQKRGASNVVSD